MTWLNRKRIEEKYNVSDRGLMTASEIKEIFGIPTEITSTLFEPVEWHHTNVEGHYGGNPTYFYDSKEIEEALNDSVNEKHNVLMKALREYKDKKKFREVERYNGYFGYSNPDGSNALWFKGTAILIENEYGSRWWILPNGQKKREIEFISEEKFKRKKNKIEYDENGNRIENLIQNNIKSKKEKQRSEKEEYIPSNWAPHLIAFIMIKEVLKNKLKNKRRHGSNEISDLEIYDALDIVKKKYGLQTNGEEAEIIKEAKKQLRMFDAKTED